MMSRIAGWALPIVGLSLAAAYAGPELLAGPRGEPLLVATPGQPALELAKFEGDACASALLLAEREQEPARAGLLANVIAVRFAADGIRVAVEKLAASGGTLVLVFDEAGRLVAAGDPGGLEVDAAQAALKQECLEEADADPV